MDNQIEKHVPFGVDMMYSTLEDLWWYDTNGSMLTSVYGAAGIALATAFIVVLFSLRSLLLTMLYLFAIGFILMMLTSMLVTGGWTLGL
jgi:hypothetical protein